MGKHTHHFLRFHCCSSSLGKVSWPIFVKHRHIMVQTFPPAAMVGNARAPNICLSKIQQSSTNISEAPCPSSWLIRSSSFCLHPQCDPLPLFLCVVGHEEQSTPPSLWRTLHRFLSAKWVLLCPNDAFSRTKLSKGPEYRSNWCTSKESPSAVATLTWILSFFFPFFIDPFNKKNISPTKKTSPVPPKIGTFQIRKYYPVIWKILGLFSSPLVGKYITPSSLNSPNITA